MPKGIPNPKQPAKPEDIATRLKCLELAAKLGSDDQQVIGTAQRYEEWCNRNA